jgi:hypothetical protein
MTQNASGIANPTTPLGRWMKDNGKSLTDLVRGAGVAWLTARDYVEGKPTTRADHAVAERIAAWTEGAFSAEDLLSVRRPAKGAA